MKEKKRLAKHTKMLKKHAHRSMSVSDLDKFAQQIHYFQLSSLGKRDIPPLLKRIINNLTCQKHKFMYCPCCKNFNDIDFNPMENITQFMKFVEQEENKYKKFKLKNKSPQKILADEQSEVDSVSQITELDRKEILNKYYEEVMTYAEKKNKQRKETRDRLYNVHPGCGRKHCKNCRHH